MKKLGMICSLAWLSCLSSCLDVEDIFLGGSPLKNENQYTFSYDSTDSLLPDEAMFFTEADYTLLELPGIDDQGNSAKTYALYIGNINTINEDTIIVYCHGNGGTIERSFSKATAIANVGGKGNYGVLVPEYLGFGLADGDVSEENMYIGVDLALNWLLAQGAQESKLYMYGLSLGSASSVELTQNPRSMTPERLILESPLASVATLSQDVVGVALGISYFSSDTPMDNLTKLAKVQQPTLIMHGTADAYVDFESNGKALRDVYKGEYLSFIPIEGARHGTIAWEIGFEEFEAMLLEFIRYRVN